MITHLAHRHCELAKQSNGINVFTGIFQLLFGLLFLLASCDREDLPFKPGKPELPDGEKVIVHFTLGEIGYSNNEVVTRNAASPNPSEGAESSPFGGDNGGSDTPVTLRAAVVPLNDGIQVRIMAYLLFQPGDTINMGYTDYTVSSNGSVLIAGVTTMSVFSGFNYMFVAYSYNNSSLPSPTETIIPSMVDDVMWGQTDVSIPSSSSSYSLHITMQHLMSKVVVRATTCSASTDFLTGADINLLCYEPSLTVRNGDMDPNGSLEPRPVTWDITNPRLPTQSSDTLYIFTDEENPTRLRIDQMEVNYNKFPGPFDVVYNNSLEAGKSYTLHVQFNWARGGAADRITWDSATGRYAITRDPTDAGLYFKFGSVVGLFSDVSPDGSTGTILRLPGRTNPSYTNFSVSRDIAWFPNSIFPSITSWATIPFFTTSDYASSKLITPEEDYHTPTKVRAGKGDPCRLVGMDLDFIKTSAANVLTYDHIDNGIWRLPTVQENEWFTEGTIGIPPTKDYWWYDISNGMSPTSPFGPGVGGAEFPERGSSVVTAESRKAKFLPAAGSRYNSNGDAATFTQGYSGLYWSNQPYNNPSGTFGNLLFFDSGSVQLYPTLFTPSVQDADWGFSVRCVRQHFDFVITVDDWGTDIIDLGTGNVVL